MSKTEAWVYLIRPGGYDSVKYVLAVRQKRYPNKAVCQYAVTSHPDKEYEKVDITDRNIALYGIHLDQRNFDDLKLDAHLIYLGRIMYGCLNAE